jgi:FkbM family methyltransferase
MNIFNVKTKILKERIKDVFRIKNFKKEINKLYQTNQNLSNEIDRLHQTNQALNQELEKFYKVNALPDMWVWLRKNYAINTIIDIGANNGDFAEFLANYFQAEETYAFEALPSYIPELEAKKATISNFHIFNVALSDRNGTEIFYQNSYGPASSFLPVSNISKNEYPETEGETETLVKVSKIDELLEIENFLPDILIKIDVQGWEDKVIKGGYKVFSCAKFVLIEMSFVPLYENQALFEEVHSLLVDLGYRLAGFKNQVNSIQSGQPLFAHCLYWR